jgi:hypothetical protein
MSPQPRKAKQPAAGKPARAAATKPPRKRPAEPQPQEAPIEFGWLESGLAGYQMWATFYSQFTPEPLPKGERRGRIFS